MTGWLDADPEGTARKSSEGWPRTAGQILVACMVLLGTAAGWLVLTRPVHHIEGDFLEREDRAHADSWLEDQLQNPVAEIRARAYLALSRIQRRDAVERLVRATQDPAPSVRAAAAFALGNLLDSRIRDGDVPPGASNALLGRFDDDERIVATRAVEALGKIGWKEAASEVTGTAAPIVVAMTALMRMGASEQVAFVTEYLDSDDQDSRWAAALAARHLRLVGHPQVRARLLPLVTDDNDVVRAAALRAVALAETGESLLAVIRTGLDHDDPKVRFEARTALERVQGVGQPESLPVGEPLLNARPAPEPRTPMLADGDYQRVTRTIGARLLLQTSQGDLEVELDYDQAPLTSEYFRRRALAGALDGVIFTAVRPNAYAVVAAPVGPIRSEVNPVPFLRGSLGMLRQGGASGGGFFLCLTALPLADSRYVNFGRLVSGDRVMDLIVPGATVHGVRQLR